MNVYFLTAEGGLLGPIIFVFGKLMNGIFVVLDKIGIGNIGLAIIIFTLLTRVILYPFTVKQQKSSKLMQIIQPEVQAIQEKYKGRNDNQSMFAQQQEIKAVYEKYGTSMTGGCLQLVIQLPIIFALYRVIMNIPAYVDSVKEHFVAIVDSMGGISAISTIRTFITENNLDGLAKQARLDGFDTLASEVAQKNLIIDFLYKLSPEQMSKLLAKFPANAVSTIQTNLTQINNLNSFLGLDLATAPMAFGLVPNVYWLVPLLAGISQYVATKVMMSSSNRAPQNSENDMAKSMQQMNVMMPLVSVFFCFQFATGIGIYWVASSVFMLIQQIFINKQMEKIDLDELVRQNVEKANQKRAKKGLPLIDPNKTKSLIKEREQNFEKEQESREKLLQGQQEKIAKNEEFYFSKEEDPNSLAAHAKMVSKFNDKKDK